MTNQFDNDCLNVTFDNHTLAYLMDRDAIRTALHCDTDPITGVEMVSVYTDDGHGNGDCIFSLPLAALQELARNYAPVAA